eukprot:9488500-Pyramimonas_sp.AAC.1
MQQLQSQLLLKSRSRQHNPPPSTHSDQQVADLEHVMDIHVRSSACSDLHIGKITTSATCWSEGVEGGGSELATAASGAHHPSTLLILAGIPLWGDQR